MAEILLDRPPADSFGAVAQKVVPPSVPEQLTESRAAVSKALEDKAAAVEPKITEAQDAARRMSAEAEQRQQRVNQSLDTVQQTRVEQPSRRLTPFLSAVNGEAPENAIAKLIQAIGLFGTGIAGAARGDARAGLAALTGAMQGWHEGDAERADRHFSDWKTKMGAALEAAEEERKGYRDWFLNANLSLEQMFKGAEMTAIMHDNKIAREMFSHQDLQRTQDFLFKQDQAASQVKHWTDQLAQAKYLGEKHIAVQREIAEAHLEQARATQALAQAQPAHGMFYIKGKGIDQISRGDLIEDLNAAREGKPRQFRQLNPAQVQLIERLSVAPPILDRLEKLVGYITKNVPGENLSAGLLERLKLKAGIGPTIQELQTLNVDMALENAAALSGGQPRITILRILRGEATPKETMTTDVAQRVIDTARTTIRNRMHSTTGDPDAYKTLGGEMAPYEPSGTGAGAANDPLGIRK